MATRVVTTRVAMVEREEGPAGACCFGRNTVKPLFYGQNVQVQSGRYKKEMIVMSPTRRQRLIARLWYRRFAKIIQSHDRFPHWGPLLGGLLLVCPLTGVCSWGASLIEGPLLRYLLTGGLLLGVQSSGVSSSVHCSCTCWNNQIRASWFPLGWDLGRHQE